MKEEFKVKDATSQEKQIIGDMIQAIRAFPHPNIGEGEKYYEFVGKALIPEQILKLKKLIEYSGKR